MKRLAKLTQHGVARRRVRASDSKAFELPACHPALRAGNDLRQRHPPCGIYLDASDDRRPTTSKQLLSRSEPCCQLHSLSLDGTLTMSVKSPCAGRVIRKPTAHVSGVSSVPSALSVNPMKHVHPTPEETEARRGEGLGLRLHSQLRTQPLGHPALASRATP